MHLSIPILAAYWYRLRVWSHFLAELHAAMAKAIALPSGCVGSSSGGGNNNNNNRIEQRVQNEVDAPCYCCSCVQPTGCAYRLHTHARLPVRRKSRLTPDRVSNTGYYGTHLTKPRTGAEDALGEKQPIGANQRASRSQTQHLVQ